MISGLRGVDGRPGVDGLPGPKGDGGLPGYLYKFIYFIATKSVTIICFYKLWTTRSCRAKG